MTPELITTLMKIARKNCWYDDDDDEKNIYDDSGGNVDDAFAMGESAGEIMLARLVLTSMNISWQE
jgi:hypothetical protein